MPRDDLEKMSVRTHVVFFALLTASAFAVGSRWCWLFAAALLLANACFISLIADEFRCGETILWRGRPILRRQNPTGFIVAVGLQVATQVVLTIVAIIYFGSLCQ